MIRRLFFSISCRSGWLSVARIISRISLILLIPLLLMADPLRARDFSPFQLSLLAPYQLFEEETVIVGVRANIFYGESDHVYGLDAGLVNLVGESSGGIALGAANLSDRHHGAQVGIFNYSEELLGLQVGLINVNDDLLGWQLGLANFTDEAFLPMIGLAFNQSDYAWLGQFSPGINQLDDGPAIQFSGLGNSAEELGWLQISGIFNYASESRVQLAGLFSASEKAFFQASGLGNYSAGPGWWQASPGYNNGGDVSFQIPGGINRSANSTLQLGALANVSGSAPIQIAGLGNDAETGSFQISAGMNRSRSAFLQAGLLFNMSGDSAWQFSALNLAGRASFQVGIMNNADLSRFVQIGLLNQSELQTGLSVGLINDAENLNGLQIGLFNIARNGFIPFLPLFNWHTGSGDPVRTGYVDASWTPLQLSIYAPGQLFYESTLVRGLRLNLFYGASAEVMGLDLGFLNWSGPMTGAQLGVGHVVNGELRGFQLGLTSVVTGDSSGLLLHPMVQYTEGDLTGFSLSGGAWTMGDVRGMQIGVFLNRLNNTDFPQLGAVNLATRAPFQLGLAGSFAEGSVPFGQISLMTNINYSDVPYQFSAGYNRAQYVSGLQFGGLFNDARFSRLQISGLMNEAASESWLQIALGANLMHGRPLNAEDSTGSLEHSFVAIAQISAFYNRGYGYLQIGGFNWSRNDYAIQAGLLNLSDRALIQMGLLNGSSDASLIQLGLVNGSLEYGGGAIQIGAINVRGEGGFLMAGGWNLANKASGLMFGLFNYADQLDGMQIGLINVYEEGAIPLTIGINF